MRYHSTFGSGSPKILKWNRTDSPSLVLTSSGVERISGATEGISFSGIGCETELRFELLRLMEAVETDDKFSRSNWSFSINLGGFSI